MKFKSILGSALLYGVPLLLVVGLLALAVQNARPSATPADGQPSTQGAAELTTRQIALSCTTDMATTFHIHPWLTITVDGIAQELPAEIGITNGCMNPVHTHDATGKIHVESPVPRDFTLGDFFAVWNKPFDAFGSLTRMTVNGEVSTEGEGLVFRDNDQITLEYTTAGD